MDVEAEDLRILTEIGFIALGAGLKGQAGLIFDGVAAARPEADAGFIGRALVRISMGDAAGAVEILRKAPPSDAVTTYLGLAYARWGAKDEARACLASVADSAAPSDHQPLARSLLEALDGAA